MSGKMREVGAFSLWILIALIFMFSYLTFISKISGIRMGLEGGAYVVVLPVAFLVFALIFWLPLFLWRRKTLNRRLGGKGALQAAGLIFVLLIPICGFGCFLGRGSDGFLGEFAMIFAFCGAYIHDRVSQVHLPLSEPGG